jgi:hypothetical protein
MQTDAAMTQWKNLLANLLPPSGEPAVAAAKRQEHLSAVIIILALDNEIIKTVFDTNGAIRPDILYERYPDLNREIVTPSRLRDLNGTSAQFAIVQALWRRLLAMYEPGPCPSLAGLTELVRVTRTFTPATESSRTDVPEG